MAQFHAKRVPAQPCRETILQTRCSIRRHAVAIAGTTHDFRPAYMLWHVPAARMQIPTEPIGSIPRPAELDRGRGQDGPRRSERWSRSTRSAVRDTVARFEATGSPVITDGEQRKYHNFWTYRVHGPAEHRARRLPDPVRRRAHPAHAAADARPVPLPALRGQLSRRGAALRARVPVKQAVISPSALSLMYPADGHPRLFARAVHRRPAARARDRDPPLPASGARTACRSTSPRAAWR